MGLLYKICYKKGSTNNAADALSRISPHPDLELHAMSTAQPIWLADLQNSYLNCSQAKQLLTELSLKPVFHHFSLVQGVIKSKGRIWLGHSPPLQQQVMQALHSSPIGGHSGALCYPHQNQETVLLASYEETHSGVCRQLHCLPAG